MRWIAVFVGWFAVGELGLAATLSDRGTSRVALLLTRLVSAGVGLTGVWLASQLWRRQPTAWRWLPLWLGAVAVAFLGLVLSTIPAREWSAVWAPLAFGLVLWALSGWWIVRKLQTRLGHHEGAPLQ